MPEHFIIVGGGQAAAQAAQSLRLKQYDGRITLIGEEPHLPYQRPPLSKKYLAGELEAERLQLRPAAFYDDADVELRLDVRVEEIDPGRRQIRLGGDERLEFDGLLLATGSAVRELSVPGAELEGIHYLRTRDDSDSIRADIASGKRLVIVGAGYIGLEVAAVAVSLGASVVVLEAADRAMARVVCPEVSAFYDEKHRAEGVDIHYGASVARFSGDGRVSAIETSSGESFDCDLVVAGIGIEPRDELAKAAGLACDDGIVVDEFARTETDAIYAAGDCASHPNPLLGKRIRLESVQNAIEQAKTAAASFLGEAQPYAQVPWFWSDQYDVKLQIAGLSGGHDRIVIRGDPAAGAFAACYLRGNVLTAIDAVNSPRDFMGGRKLIEAGTTLDDDRLADTSVNLTDLL